MARRDLKAVVADLDVYHALIDDPARARLSPKALWWGALVWVGVLVGIPLLCARFGPAALMLDLIIGIRSFYYIAHARHFMIHGYYRGIDNRRAYAWYSLLLSATPENYAYAHRKHHAHVHTTRDCEFFVEGWGEDPALRKRQFLLELFFGNIAWEFATEAALRNQGVVRSSPLRSLLPKVAFLGGLSLASWVLHPDSLGWFVFHYVWLTWLCAFVSRHNQWMQHLGVPMEGSLEARNLATRSVRLNGPLGFVWRWWTFGDAEDHVVHHVCAQVPTQAVGYPFRVPSGTQTISLLQYPAVLRDYYRALMAWPESAGLPSSPGNALPSAKAKTPCPPTS